MQNVWPSYKTYKERMHWYYTVYFPGNHMQRTKRALLSKFPSCAMKLDGCYGKADTAHHTREGYGHLGFERTDSFDHLVPVCRSCHHKHHGQERWIKRRKKLAKGLKNMIRLLWLP